jgi:thiamine-monophosphate kinase
MPPMTILRNEDALLKRVETVFSGQDAGAIRLGIGDDAALIAPRRGYETVLTCDWFLQGSHFLLDRHPPDAVGWKSLSRAASDIAGLGATPGCFLLSIALPVERTGKWLDGFLAGLRRASRRLQCPLAGGDTTRSKDIAINITVVGEVPAGRAVLRGGAKPGDQLFVSGTLGEADLGLRYLLKKRGMARPANTALRKHLYPEARIALGQWLGKNRLATAMMDMSDGLSTDLPRLCSASGVGARVHAEWLPRTSLTNAADALQLALHGGDEYELLFAVKPRNVGRLGNAFEGLRLTRIGEITAERGILLESGGKLRKLESRGWDPFRRS